MKETASKSYHIKMELNNQIFECDTKDLYAGLNSLKQKVFKTRTLFTITRSDGYTCSKILMVRKARLVFNKKIFMDVFINQLIFKPNG